MTRPAPLQLPRAPRKALVFSGHRVDAPGRATERFTPRLEAAAAARIADALDALEAGPLDAGLTQGAAGGDLLFTEACLARGVPVQLMLPLPEPEFIAASVLPCADGARWRERYFAAQAALPWPPCTMPPVSGDPFEACNRWLLDTALACGAAELHLVCLWNGEPGDGPGGTAHMVDEIRRASGRIAWIDTRTL
jgi:hypothetical protein